MQDLHLVGFTTDRRHLIFSARRGAKSGSFLVPVDDELIAVVTEIAEAPDRLDAEEPADEDVVPAPPPRVEAKLSVREVQARLRAGESSAEVAADAGVAEDWVERFALPIRAEQRQIVERALGLRMERPRAGESAKPLGVAVASAMAERGVAFTDEGFAKAWTSRLIGQDHWVIEFHFTQRGRQRTVGWTFDVAEGRITTSDRTASQIGFVAPPPSSSSKSSPKPRTGRSRSASTSSGGGDDGDESSSTGPRSTRGDGRPDSVKSTKAMAAAAASAEKAMAARPARKKKSAAEKKSSAEKKTAGKKQAATKNASKKKSASKKASAPRKTSAPRKKSASKKKTAPGKQAAPKKAASPKRVTKRATGASGLDAAREPETLAAPGQEVDETPSVDAAIDETSAGSAEVDRDGTAADERAPADGEPTATDTGTEPDADAGAEPDAGADGPDLDHRLRVRLREHQDPSVASSLPPASGGDQDRPEPPPTSRPTAAFRSGAAVHAASSLQATRPVPEPAPGEPRAEAPADRDRPGRAGDQDERSERANGRRPRRTRQLRAR